jgi:hypothetical protein
MPQPYINNFYRITFTWVDPIALCASAYMYIFAKVQALQMVHPGPIAAPDTLQSATMHQVAVLLSFVAITTAVVLRVSSDAKIWKIIQAAVLAVEAGFLATTAVTLEEQGRLALGKLQGGEYVTIGGILPFMMIRVAYLIGIGGNGGTRTKKEL